MTILNKFPKGYKPRDIQVNCLTEIEKDWDKYDIFVLNLPVASGKSFIAKTIIDYYNTGAITTPTNMLVNQYREEFPKLNGIIGKANYSCSEKGYNSCKDRSYSYRNTKGRKHCHDCPWLTDNKKMHNPYLNKYITNNHLYAQMQKHMPILIADEAHNLIEFLQEYNSTRISYSRYRYPRSDNGFINRAELKDWINSLKGLGDILDNNTRGQKALRLLYQELNSDSPNHLIKEEITEGEDKDGNLVFKKYLKLSPLDIRNYYPILWPRNKVRKVILMSATIGPKDIEELGLGGYRIKYIYADSCIPAENRPVLYGNGLPINSKNLRENTIKLTDNILNLVNKQKGKKGLIHATYQQARIFKSVLKDNNRFIYHNKDNKSKVYQQFRKSNEDKVLICSGLYEGIDLPNDFGRFQIIGKVPFPYLGEPAVRYRMAKDPEWYSWQATKVMLQACGRISRSPDDYGETYILDNNFTRLYNNNQDMFPSWFKEGTKLL